MAPAGTPEAVIRRLSDEQRAIVSMPEIRERIAGAGFDPMPMSAADMRRTMTTEFDRWGKVVREANIKPE